MLADIGRPKGHIVVEHFRPHVSDLAGEWLIRRHPNESLFPLSTKEVSVYYVNDGGSILRDAEGKPLGPMFELEKSIPMTFLGVGGGEHDEHGKNIIECEATLMGRKIKLLRSPRPFEMLGEIEDRVFKITLRDGQTKFFVVEDARYRDFFKAVAQDDITGSAAFSIGKIVDALHDACNEEKVRELVFQLFDVATRGPVSKVERNKVYACALAALSEIVDYMRSEYHEKATARIMPWLAKRQQAVHWEPLDLVDCVMLFIYHNGAGLEALDVATEWAMQVVSAELKNQHHFHTATAEEAKKAVFHDVNVRVFDDGKERIESRVVAVVESDDRYVHKYLIAKNLGYGAAMVIKQNSRGQAQIFPGSYEKTFWRGDRVKYNSVPMTFLMPYVVAALRDAEGADSTTPWSGKNSLTDELGPLGQNIWHFSKGGQILNGSLTAPHARATKLSLKQITEIVLEGVDVKYGELRSKTILAGKARRMNSPTA